MVCCDATYRLNWLNYPVFIVGLVSPTGRFSLSLVVISSHEDYSAQLNILNFVKAQGITPSFLMGKGRGKKKSIIFTKFSARGVPPLPPFAENN